MGGPKSTVFKSVGAMAPLAPPVPTPLVIITVSVAFQTISWMKLTEYSNEVFDHPIPFDSFGMLTFVIMKFLIIVSIIYISKLRKKQCSFPLTVALLTTISITVGGCFFPFMILAFIHDPLQTSFIYLFEIICILCLHYIIVGLISFFYCITIYIKSRGTHNDEFKAILSFSCRTFWSSYVIVYSLCVFTLVSIYIFTFGNFNNFATLQNLTFPLIIAIITLVLLKPTKDYLKSVYHDYIKEYHNQNNDPEEADDVKSKR